MNILPRLTSAIALAALSACGNNAEELRDRNQNTDSARSQAKVASAQHPVMATSDGSVTQIDQAAGKVTIAHAPIPEAGWPAMTMTFDADAALLADIEPGDDITFDVEIAKSGGEVKAIRKK